MPLKRKHDPGYKLPEVIEPDENCCICIPIPNDFNHKMAFLGQLDELGYWWNWERDELKQGREAAAVWRKIVACIREEMDMSGCGCGGDTIGETLRRIGYDGIEEISNDGGETWTDNTTGDPRFYSAAFPGLAGPDGDTKKCEAANSMVGFFEDLQAQEKQALDNNESLAELFALLTAVLISLGIVTGGTTIAIAAVLNFVINLFAHLIPEDFDAQFTNDTWVDLLCVVYCNMGEDGSISMAQWIAIQEAVLTDVGGYAGHWLKGHIQALGTIGLTNAGRANYGGTRECDDCSCSDVWCYLFDFTVNDGGWIKEEFFGDNNGVYQAASGWRFTDAVNTNTTPDSANRLVYIDRTFDISTLTKVTVTYDYVGGTYDSNTRQALSIGLNAASAIAKTRAEMVDGNGQEFIWEGSVGGVTNVNVYLRSSIDIVSPYVYSGDAKIVSVKLEGTGDNPFGSDNCP